ncbi:MAG: hypothetical protein PVF58_10110 [Candidatus Methanofastidiosia archaeon]|jgi:hypothetical protein
MRILLNIYLPPKVIGISAFVLFPIYSSGMNYLEENQINPHVSIMGFTASTVTTSILFIGITLITIGALLFSHKEL